MPEIYRKTGRVVRYESGTLIRVSESGWAVEEGGLFRCQPQPAFVDLPEIDEGPLQRAVAGLSGMVAAPLRVERMILALGVAAHRFADRQWTDATRRMHLSITTDRLRMLIDQSSFDLDELPYLLDALGRAGAERIAPRALVLAPRVAAALLPLLAGVRASEFHLVQAAGGVDGKGQRIERHLLRRGHYPNWYRPSYRVRPVRAPFHLQIVCPSAEINPDLPRGLALLAPIDATGMRLLCSHGGETFPATIPLRPPRAAGPPQISFPFGAGSFGTELML